ncbi:precorrin-4 C11-methyltransferase [Halanaerobium congolense]|jgi:precorrin-4 C11-methyltransferase|uniref:Precorrin-4 C11-methyltransferase n=1 Tax=Halanaerobium congolense TaxID=54121 RepID=A0A1G6L326_9FIRM|nr:MULTISPECIES: precorrin-4 C(11)-methyltransferase [Halanaerobium]PUU87269.1 MAG: precorrin-4 C(11)-methyltransferase [Halanaerobium sp.]PXV64817.1 precorrin-4 C11-methyltransferase [Halanaerobium congolense]TDP14344.1 precorrin-4 C11-methyltransferase [Halanaerobium congolense]TDS35393.1 precorrin-4 C11-methyltransferase [Halanaerobium congolense]SDC37056.1 precorrin-4 C11-methyltransferase [Halanaerobium congolense]
MKVYIIGAGAGDPELLTIKGKKAIENSEIIIYAGSLVNPEVLKYNKAAKTYNSAKLSLDQVIEIIKKAAAEDKNVARVHTGDPSIYGAIKEQIDSLAANGIDYQIIPGVSSFLAAAAALEAEYTLPDVSQTVILTRQAGRTPVPEKEKLASLAQHQASMAIFLSVQMIEEVVDNLSKEYPLTTPAAIVARASWSDQKIIKSTLGEIAAEVKAAGIKKTALILVGDFLDSDYQKSKLYDKNFAHEYRNGKKEKKAILVVSFGTSYHETRKKTIKACEKRIKDHFPEYEVKRAFTSGMIIEKLKQRDNIYIDNPKEALKKLYKEGYQEVIVQPLHIINGSEFHDLVRTVKKFRNNFRNLKWGNALLSKTADYFDVAKILKTEVENNSKEQAVLLMGHGSSHAANSDYAALDYVLKERGMKDYYVGAVEGYPEIKVVIKQLKEKKYKKIKLAPLMLVAGDHAQNDMIGEDEDSWKNILENEGFEVEVQLKGLGEYEGIQNKYAAKLRSLLEK